MKYKHRKKSRFSALAVLALCAVMIVTFMPNMAFGENENVGENNLILTKWNNENLTAVAVKENTSKEAVEEELKNTYSSLEATVRRSYNENEFTKNVEVKWDTYYYSPTVGNYSFHAVPSETGTKYQVNATSSPTVQVYVTKDGKLPSNVDNDIKTPDDASGTSDKSVYNAAEKIYGKRKSTVTRFTYPSSESLGSVGKYGVFAKNYKQTGDMEGSVAAEHLNANANIGRSSNVKSYDPTESYDYIGDFSTTFRSHAETKEDWIFGNTVTLDNNYNNGNGLRAKCNGTTINWNGINELGSSAQNEQDSPYKINFDNAFDGLRTYASAQYGKENTEGTKINNTVNKAGVDSNNYAVEISCCEGANIVNLKASDMQEGKIKVTGPSNGNYSLIINVTELKENSYSFGKDVEIDGLRDGFDPKIGHVMFNFGSYDGTLDYSGNNYAGVVLAPNATVKFSTGHHAGSVYANTIESNVEILQINFISNPSITVQKNFINGTWDKNTRFGFSLMAVEGFNNPNTPKTWSSDTQDETPMPGDSESKKFDEVMLYIGSKNVNDSGNYVNSFKEIKYEKNGTYYYELKEETNNKDAEANITYDSNVYLIKVQVENGKPEMSYCKFDKDKVDISKVTSDGVTWTTCTDNPTFSFYNSSDITVQKNFINGTWDNNTSFKFSLKAVNGLVNNSADRLVWDRSINNNTPIPEKSEVNTDDKTASITIGSKNVNDSGNYVNSFKGIKYAKDGTYYYELEEEKPKDADTNINYDSNIYLIKVHVEDGKSEITYYKVDKEADSTVTKQKIILNNNEWKTYQANSTFEFTNTPKGSAILQVSKNLVDEQGKVVNTGENWKNQSFTFTLTPLEKTNPMPENKTVEIKSDTKDYQALFGAIKYTKPGTYSYTITEDQTKPEGNIKYDQASYTATVTVSEDMTASVKYTKNDETKASPDSAVFNNVITSTKPESNTISISGTKTWNDNNDQDGKRPDKITVNLLANGVKTASKIVTAEDGWNYTFDNQPKYADGKEIKYTVTEDPVASYTTTISGYNITNTENTVTPPTPTPTYTTYTVHKVWDLGSGETVPDSVQMQLYKNGAAYGSPVAVTRASGWTYTWTGLPQTENGKLNTWSVKEVDPDNQYTATVVNGMSSATVTNRSNNNAGGKTQVSVHKVWKLDNGRTAASSVQAQLYRNGEAYGDPVTLSAGNSWSHVWTGLTKTDAQGNTISWTVREVKVPSGFTSTVTGTDRSFTITNDDKPKDNHNKNNKPVSPNNNNNKPVTPNTNNKKNTPVNPGTPSIPKNTGTVANRGTSAGTPRTGDQTSLGFWLAMLTAGAAGTAAAVLLKRRNRKEEE